MSPPDRRPPAVNFIFVTLVLAVMGAGLVIPVLPSLVRSFAGGDFAAASHTYGWIILVFAIMQFIGSPILGALSDRFGRRRVILIATAGAVADYVVMANAPTLGWLFFARGIAGFTAGIIATANAYLIDVTPPEKRAQNFGLLGAAFGLGFVLGPLIGGTLGSINLRLPFWAAAGLALVNFTYGLFVLPESLPADRRRAFSWVRANPAGAMLRLREHPVVLGLALTSLAFWIAQTMLHSVWVLYTDYRFHWGPRDVGLSLGLTGICSALVQALLTKRLVPLLGEERSVLAGFAVGIATFTAYGLCSAGWLIYVFIVCGSFAGISGPAMQAYLSRHVDPAEQGAIQGAFVGITSMAAIMGQPVAAWSFGWAVAPGNPWSLPGLAFFEAAVLMAVAMYLAARTFRRAAAAKATPAQI